jgi:hypothetical protein
VNWTQTERGLVLGANAIGQIFSCLSGIVIHRIGGATFLGVGKLGEAILSLMAPLLIKTNVHLIIANRFILGLFEVTALCIESSFFNFSTLFDILRFSLPYRDCPLLVPWMYSLIGPLQMNESAYRLLPIWDLVWVSRSIIRYLVSLFTTSTGKVYSIPLVRVG